MKETNIWIKLALDDLKMAELAMEEKIYNQVCFHSQQAVEKVLKGYIQRIGISPPRTHKLVDLLSLVKSNIIKNLHNEIILLDRFYIPTRYPDALPGSLPEGLPLEKDAKSSLETAATVVEIIKTKI